jgi:hypothetical protein
MLTNRVQPQRLSELPRMHRRCSKIARLAGLDDIVQRLERLLDRRVIIEAMDLIEIDVIGAEPPQARVDLGHDRPARQAGPVRARAHPPVHLGRDHDLVAAREILQRPAEDLLAGAVRIDIRRVEEIDASLQGPLDEGAAFLFVERPGVTAPIGYAVAHAAKAKARHIQARMTEFHIIHHLTPNRMLVRQDSLVKAGTQRVAGVTSRQYS